MAYIPNPLKGHDYIRWKLSWKECNITTFRAQEKHKAWQKITKFCKSIIIQLKNKLKKKKDKGYGKMTNLTIQVKKEIKATLL